MQLNVPTSLTDSQIRKYQELCKVQCGIELTYEQAHEEGLNLVGFYAALLETEMENIQNGCGVIDIHGK